MEEVDDKDDVVADPVPVAEVDNEALLAIDAAVASPAAIPCDAAWLTPDPTAAVPAAVDDDEKIDAVVVKLPTAPSGKD